MDLVVKALMVNTPLRGVLHLNNRLLYLEVQDPREGEDPKEGEAGLPKVDVGVTEADGVVVGCPNNNMVLPLSIKEEVGEDIPSPNSNMVLPLIIKEGVGEDLLSLNNSMVAHLSIKAEEREDLLSKEVVDMAVAEVDMVVVWALVVATTQFLLMEAHLGHQHPSCTKLPQFLPCHIQLRCLLHLHRVRQVHLLIHQKYLK